MDSMGVASGCGCIWRYIDSSYTTTYLLIFAAASLLFVHFLKCFSFNVLVPVHFCNLCNNFSRSINTHTDDYGRPAVAI